MTDPEIINRMVRNEADMAYRRRVQTIFEWLQPQAGDHILDAGCGRGFYLKFIRHASDASIVGLELELPFVRIAKGALEHDFELPPLVNGSLYELPFPDHAFDKIIISEVLEHVPDDAEALRSLSRVLRPGGLIAITVPNANYPFWWDPVNRTLENVFHTHIQNGVLAGIWANHVRLYTPELLRKAVTSAGLEVAAERSFTHHSFPFIHNIVYGFGKTALEAGILPDGVASAADRHNLSGERGSLLNPVNFGLTVFEWFDRKNSMDEPAGRSTVNLCILARKPLE
jgi:ubiquinone/menaquinone biosynthesis C-methylase UbiE